jgi:Ca-activated chloride channel family protein
LVEKGLNRVLILTDGLANSGETRPDEIATRVHAALQRGVSTSTFGLGRQYNEDLLESMARSGDGNYYYIENPNQLPQIFASELQGLSATQCTRVTLKLQTAEHVTLVDVLNELTHDAQGRWELPNLLSGVPVYVVFRFRVVPGRSNVPLARFTLEWLPAHAVDPVQAQIEWLIPTVSASDYPELPVDPQVQEKTTLLTVSRKMKEASVAADRRDVGSAQQLLAESRELLGAVPLSASISSEFDALERVQQVLDQGDMATFSKRNKFRSYQRAASKPILDDPQDETA